MALINGLSFLKSVRPPSRFIPCGAGFPTHRRRHPFSFRGRRNARTAEHDLWAQDSGSGVCRPLLTTLPCDLASGRDCQMRTTACSMGIVGTFPLSRQIKPRRVNLFSARKHKRNLGSCAESTVEEQDVFINSRETRGLRRGATSNR